MTIDQLAIYTVGVSCILIGLAATLYSLNKILQLRTKRTSERMMLKWSDRILRHPPTGLVGKVIGIRAIPHRILGWFRVRRQITLLIHPDALPCCFDTVEDAMTAMLHARLCGWVRDYPPHELVRALPQETTIWKQHE
jgi:hypothetical protein